MSSSTGECELLSDILNKYPQLLTHIGYGTKENASLRKNGSQQYMTWASSHNHVNHDENEVPQRILPNSRKGIIHDFRIKCKHGPDDKVYDKHQDLRRKLARGNTVLQIIDGPSAGFYLCLYAIKKFTGQSALDDDDRADVQSVSSSAGDRNVSELYFTEPSRCATRIVSTWKANGEACHLAAMKIEGQVLFITGTKNTHMVVAHENDIEKYTQNRYSVAKGFVVTVFQQLAQLTEDQRNSFIQLLCLTGFTAVFEILNREHQHVEDLSYLDKNELNFIAWTSTDPDCSALTAVPPDVGIEIARALGLTTIQCEQVSIEGVGGHCKDVKKASLREGNVMYYLNANQETIGLVKIKTAWYVMCRAIREKAKFAASQSQKKPNAFSLSSAINKAQKRLDDINAFLMIDVDVLSHWKSLADAFIRFVVTRLAEGRITLNDVNNRFPPLWRDCMNQHNLQDSLCL